MCLFLLSTVWKERLTWNVFAYILLQYLYSGAIQICRLVVIGLSHIFWYLPICSLICMDKKRFSVEIKRPPKDAWGDIKQLSPCIRIIAIKCGYFRCYIKMGHFYSLVLTSAKCQSGSHIQHVLLLTNASLWQGLL